MNEVNVYDALETGVIELDALEVGECIRVINASKYLNFLSSNEFARQPLKAADGIVFKFEWANNKFLIEHSKDVSKYFTLAHYEEHAGGVVEKSEFLVKNDSDTKLAVALSLFQVKVENLLYNFSSSIKANAVEQLDKEEAYKSAKKF